MVYTYRLNTNTLSSVLDNANNTSGFNDFNKLGDDYTYDTNGNMITDKNKKINAIIYNHLNLPTKITFGATGNIVYIYNAAGQKLEKIVNSLLPTATVTTTNYLGGYQYQGVGTATPTLQFFPTAEGYVKNTVVNSTNNYSYVFNYTDHLGNVRLSYSDNITKDGIITSNEIVEENNYYPFGLKHKGYNANNLQPSYKYKYNGKELQDELGLNVYDYGFRLYDPAIGRMQNPDPLAELAYDLTPNRYCFNNPVNFIDPTGLWETTANGYTTNKPEDIKRFMSYMETENVALNNTPTNQQTATFIDGEMSAGGHGKLSDGSTLADELTIKTYKQVGGGIKGYADEESFSNFWHGVQKSLTPDGLDTRTLGQNLLGLSYPGGNNPKTYRGNDDFSYVPKSIAEYPAIGHDRRYANLGTSGAYGLLTDTRAISTDFRFVTMSILAVRYTDSYKEKAQAMTLGLGLGALAGFKTVYHFSTQPTGSAILSILQADSVANKGGVSYSPSGQ